MDSIMMPSPDLSHLAPFDIDTPSAKLGRAIRSRCWFTTHTYTRAPGNGEAGPFLLDKGRRPRLFCPERFALSHHLPAAMQLLADPGRHVWQTAAERNWLHRAEVAVIEGGVAITYQVFFAVKKAPRAAAHDVELVVESAYALDPQRMPKVRGHMVIAGVLSAKVEGRPVHTQPGPRNR